MMKKMFATCLMCMLSFAGACDTLYWQISQTREHMLFANSILSKDFNAIMPIEDTILGECLFIMVLEDLKHDEDNDWIAKVLDSNCDEVSREKWNRMKIYYCQ